MSEIESQQRISVSEERLRRILAEFRLDIVKEFASEAAFDALETRVTVLELWRAARESANQTKRETSAKTLGWVAALSAFVGGLAASVGALVTYVSLHHHG